MRANVWFKYFPKIILLMFVLLFPACKKTNLPPNLPTIISPEQSSIYQDQQLSLSWLCTDPENDNLVYDIFCGETNPPPVKQSNFNSTIYDPGLLEKNKIYYWRINAKDENNITEGPVWSFSTGANRSPDKPFGPGPELGESVNTNTITLSWDCTDPNLDYLAYYIYMGKNSFPERIKIDHQTTEYYPGQLESNAVYYWYVVAIDVHGSFTVGPVWYFGCMFNGKETGTIIDNRDGKKYNTVKLNGQWWMSENLNYSSENDSRIYNDNPENEEVYGRLYNWEDAYKSCPSGWRLPQLEEWESMASSLGGSSIAGGQMKTSGTNYWKSPNNNADNFSGFSALPGGFFNSNGMYSKINEEAVFWTASEITTSEGGWAIVLRNDSKNLLYSGFYRNSGFSVRCVK